MSTIPKVNLNTLEVEKILAKNLKSLPRQALPSALLPWYKNNKVNYPWREDWDILKDPYRIWLSEVMLQQTTLKVVVPAYIKFVAKLPNIVEFSLADSEVIRSLTKGLGYYSRFHRMHAAARVLVDNWKKSDQVLWPKNEKQWRELPGIGPYTASALASICNQERAAVVDGNVERVLCRVLDLRVPINYPILKGKFKNYLDQVIPSSKPGDFNQGLMELGQLICRPIQPQCEKCVLQANCLAFAHHSQTLAPQPKLRPLKKQVEIAVVIPKLKNQFIMTRSGRGGRFLKNEPGFPIVDFENNFLLQEFKLSLNKMGVYKKIKDLGHFKHTITNHNIVARCFLVDFEEINIVNSREKASRKKDVHAGYNLFTFKKAKASIATSLDLKAFKLISFEN